MKKTVFALFAASSLLVGAPLPAMAGVDVAAACDGTVPEAWNRPGGFCDQNDFNKSLSDPSSDQGCLPAHFAMLGSDDDARMLVAGAPSGCCNLLTKFRFDTTKGDAIVAYSDPCLPG
jgi:hypothetical protein